MTTGRMESYWKSEVYEALADYIRMDCEGLKDAAALLMDGGRLVIRTAAFYHEGMTAFPGRDEVLSLLVHLGCLGFEQETSEVFIPNREILDAFKTSKELQGGAWQGEEERAAPLQDGKMGRICALLLFIMV